MILSKRKTVIFGLDSAPPELVFYKWLDYLPNIKHLVSNGIFGKLESTIPAITCPAWASMVTSTNPGKLGMYGFRNRNHYNYEGLSFVDSNTINVETIWDILSKQGKKTIIIGVPPTYPPKPICNGYMVSCFLTPDKNCQYTYPDKLKYEVEKVSDGYILDVSNFRNEAKEHILNTTYEMTRKRFKLARHFIQNEDWDFLMMVEMGTDRIQHAFWGFFDNRHPRYLQGNKYENVIFDYYKYIDDEIGNTLPLLDENTLILLVSDHGAKMMEGGICINEWLINNGYLKLVHYPDEVTQISKQLIDWNKTMVWGEGGYYGRLFFNVKDREPSGIIPKQNYEYLRNELIAALEDLRDEKGQKINTKVFKPEEIYTECRNIPPDLIVYYGDLSWRSIGSVGHNTIWADENDTGYDDANHAQYGIFVMYGDNGYHSERRDDLRIMDVTPTVLDRMGIDIPWYMEGSVIK
ncbi:MAG: cytochrome p450 hydroxylase MmcK [Candidatus Scalindua rubra]|uniref:Cytochrome p450 hydroxylase MmcK n=1 Tax=Candidatus Scalindua rubra TaxID=1872076 RepID=A0A1E3X8T9_9BACT|nr:MAG: cytochrome p450 hydroxylase MmcK [Candidatus Scalindua rubra]